MIALCIAFCVIASLLLHGGHTAHSTFSIPVHSLAKDSICQINKKSEKAEMLHHAKLIIRDEVIT